MSDLLTRLTSRKFLAAIGAAVTLASQHQWAACAGVVVAYIGSEGYIDAKTVNAATEVEKKAHALATQLLDELAQGDPPTPMTVNVHAQALDPKALAEVVQAELTKQARKRR